MAYRHPAPSEIWGADMSRSTFRRFVEADAREQRTLNHVKLARARLEARLEGPEASGHSSSSGIPLSSALDEFRIARAFPTLLKIISTQSSHSGGHRGAAATSTVVNTTRFSPSLRELRELRGGRGSAAARSTGPVLGIDTVSGAVPIVHGASAARVPVRYGNVVRMRSQRSYLQGTGPAQSDDLLGESNLMSPGWPSGAVSSAPRIARDVDGRVPAAVAAAAAAAASDDDETY